MDESFRRAMRENRLGFLTVDREAMMLPGLRDSYAALQREFMVIDREELDEHRDRWRGYSPKFDALELGQPAPEYICEVTVSDDGAVHEFRFMRAR